MCDRHRNAALFAVVGLMAVLASPGAVRADVSSTNPAAIVIYPKIVVDNLFPRTDTVIQLTNVAASPVNVRCFYVNANGHCSDDPEQICDPNREQAPDGGALYSNSCSQDATCSPGWIETDFRMRLTPHQPIVWSARDGLASLPLSDSPGPDGDFNSDSSIPPVSERPFLGYLTCVVVSDDERPTDRNWLIGQATIDHFTQLEVDIASYNALGVQAIEGANNGDDTLVLGEEYNACPNIIELDHFFDDAQLPSGFTARTDVTFVPCTVDFNLQRAKRITVQFLVFNEFEQRFSTSRPIECLTNIPLSDLVPRLGDSDDAASIFNVAVQGTLTGKTLARGVNDDSEDAFGGETFLVIAQELRTEIAPPGEYSAAFVAHQRGARVQTDVIQLPPAGPGGL